MKEPTCLVTMRQRDMRKLPVKSRTDRCSLCRERVWVSLSSPKVDKIYCSVCAFDLMQPGDEAMVTKRTMAEVRKVLGQ